jgi:ATP-dependent DNA ligase
MECLAVAKLPDDARWVWEIKLDGYRAIAVRSGGVATLFSRRKKSLGKKFPYIVEALAGLPAETVVDGELVALDDRGRPEFNLLQNFRGASERIYYYIFDLLCLEGRDLTLLPLNEHRQLLSAHVQIRDERIRVAGYVEVKSAELLAAVCEQGLEGIVGKRRDSLYEPGKRSGAWIKHRVNRGQEFVIGGYFPGPHGIDSLSVGYYDGDQLIVRGEDSEWIRPIVATPGVLEAEVPCDAILPVCESARDAPLAIRRRTERGKDEEGGVAEARSGRAD